jgi:sulfotransferase family protein
VDRPIFISGCNRGGTTILADLLAAHPQIKNVGEGHTYSEGQYIWRLKFPDRSNHRWAVEPWLSQMRKTAAHATPELVRFFRERFSAEVGPCQRILEKTPANAVRIPFIDACFPDARFVHVIRDGRDTVCSLMARRVALRFAPWQWVGAHTTALADLGALPPERVVIVRYEALMASPVRGLCEVARACELRVDEGVSQIFAATAARQIEPAVSRWPQLSEARKQFVLGIISELQMQLGYPLE